MGTYAGLPAGISPFDAPNLEAFWQADGMSTESKYPNMAKFTKLIQFEFKTTASFDKVSGDLSGKRLHSPLIIRKALDQSSPLLMQALSENQVIKTSSVLVYGVNDKDGKKVQQYKIDLTNARVVDIIVLGGTGPKGTEVWEEVHFVFAKIAYNHVPSTKQFTDDWTANV